MTISISSDFSGLMSGLADMAAGVEDAVRPAAQAGADVLYREVKKNVSALGQKTGKLLESIYQVYSKEASAGGRAEYHVSWNHLKAPHGHLVEYGHIQRYVQFVDAQGNWVTVKNRPLAAPRHVAARPFLRPAQGRFNAALDVAMQQFYLHVAAQGFA